MKFHFAQSADLLTQAGHSSEQLSSRSEKLQHYDHQYNHPQHYSDYEVTSLWRFNTNITAGLSEPTHRGNYAAKVYTSSTRKFSRWIISLKQHNCSLTMWNVSSTVLYFFFIFSHRWKVHMGTGPSDMAVDVGVYKPSHTTCCSSGRKVNKCSVTITSITAQCIFWEETRSNWSDYGCRVSAIILKNRQVVILIQEFYFILLLLPQQHNRFDQFEAFDFHTAHN